MVKLGDIILNLTLRTFRENFLQVDIFYKELSFGQISQQPAFEFLSLLSEVGGFLGLLLGASVLTVCELLDYISLTMLKRWRSKRAVSPVPEDIEYYNPPRF